MMSGEWNGQLQTLALSSDYFMHGVLSMTAMYIAYLLPGEHQKYSILAMEHQNLALKPFQEDTAQIDHKNCHRVFASSIFLIITQYASFGWLANTANLGKGSDLKDSKVQSTLEHQLIQWITWHRGCRSILNSARNQIEGGPLRPIFDNDEMRGTDQKLTMTPTLSENYFTDHDEAIQSLEKLANYLEHSPEIKENTTVAEMEAYLEAIGLLERLLFLSFKTHNPNIKKVVSSMWPTKVSDTFIRLLTEMREPAFAIFAHYCLLMADCSSCWWLEQGSRGLFGIARQRLSDEWSGLIQHPAAVFSDISQKRAIRA